MHKVEVNNRCNFHMVCEFEVLSLSSYSHELQRKTDYSGTDYRVVSHEFGVVQPHRTSSNL